MWRIDFDDEPEGDWEDRWFVRIVLAVVTWAVIVGAETLGVWQAMGLR